MIPRVAAHAIAVLALFVVFVGFGSAPGASAADEPPAWAYEMSTELMSPFCPGRTLAECPSPQAESLRMWILVQGSAGRGEDDVREELYERYGDQIRATPKAEGFGTAAYVIPVVAFLLGGVLLAIFLRRSTAAAGSAPAAALDAESERKLDEMLS